MTPEAPEVLVAKAVRRARAAQPAWVATSPADRARVLRRFHDVVWRRRHEIAAIVARENGKPYVEALGADVLVTLDFTSWTARTAPRFLRSSWRRVDGLLFWRKRVRFEKAPLGVIGVISPWNYPFFLPTACVLPAIACGNSVVLKPSEVTPESGGILESLWREAGLPEGVLNIIQGDGHTGAALTRGGVDKMIFTGSTAAGRKVAQACADQLIPCSLELGGSDAAIVLADADVRHAADGITWGRFTNAGQSCVAPKRVFVEAAVYDAFVAAMARAVSSLKVGPGGDASSDVGPVVHGVSAGQITALRDDAIAKGARVVATASTPDRSAGNYFPPTLLADVTPGMRVLSEETFGPLLPVVSVRDAEEAIARANGSVHGLAASVWTRDRTRGLAVARRLEAGTVMINDSVSVVGMADVPYGGVKQSGLGRLHGIDGLAACVRASAVVDDRFATWHQPWWFAYDAQHLAGFEDFGRLTHGATLWERLRGLPGVVRLLLRQRGTA